MQTTRKELLDDFLSWVTEKGDSVARNLAERALNRALLSIWMKANWSQFRAAVPYQFTTVAGTRDYALPVYFGRISTRDGHIRNVTRGIDLVPFEQDRLDYFDAAAGTSLEQRGTPRTFVLDNTVGVGVQPSSAGEAVEVVSSSTSDTNVFVYVEGFDASGNYQRTQVTLNGTTAAPVGTWSRIERFGKSYAEGTDATTEFTSSVGTVTLRTVSGPTTLQALAADEASVEHPLLTLYPLPDAAEGYVVPYMRAPRPMRHDADPCPRLWGNALFEEMQVQWLVNGGTLKSDAQAPRPHLKDLLEHENAGRVAATRHRRPYSGGGR